MATTGDNIRALRLARGWTLARLGSKVGVDQTLVSHWERGRRDPEPHLDMVAKALGVPESDLLGDAAPCLVEPARAAALPSAPDELDLFTLSEFLAWIRRTFKLSFSPNTVYGWVYSAKDALPAYHNHLKKSPKGEPTLLFDLTLARPWVTKHFEPANRATPSFH